LTFLTAWLFVIAGGIALLLMACALMLYERYRPKSSRPDSHPPDLPKRFDDGRIHHAS